MAANRSRPTSARPHSTRARVGPNTVHGHFLRRKFFLQNCAIRRNAARTGSLRAGSEKQTAQHRENLRKKSLSNTPSVGIGVGLLSARPSTGLAPGVAYFATDVGTQGTLYIATSSSTWNTYYQPHQYPHELVVDIAPPSNLTIR